MRLVAPAVLLAISTACVPHLTSPADTDGPDDTGACDAWVAPENHWPIATPPDCLEGTGFTNGLVPPDFRLKAQTGETVSLWQFYGDVVVLDISTMWCGPCQQLATTGEDTYDDYVDQGFMYVTVLPQDFEGNPPDNADLNDWADNFGLSTPVVGDSDPTALYTGPAVPDGTYPVVLVLDRTMKVTKKIDPPTDENLRAAIEAAL